MGVSGDARSAVVTGAGVVSAAGEAASDAPPGPLPPAFLSALREGRPFARDITAFEPAEGEPTRGCEITDFDLARHVAGVKSYIDRTSALALAAAKLALEDAGLVTDAGALRHAQDAGTELVEGARDGGETGEIGLVYGTQWGCLDSMELFYGKLKGGNPRFAPPLPFSHSYANSPASILAIELGLRGHHAVYSTGRTSGAWTLLAGADAVELGRADRMACAASDSFSRAAFAHYLVQEELLPDGPDGPGGPDVPDGTASAAGASRGRFLLGEGAACLVLEEAEHAASRGARVRANVLASGAASAADRVTALEEALREALLRACVMPDDVCAVFGASASPAGADAEAAALVSSLGVSEERAREMLVTVGGALGETMAASGVMAAAAACSLMDSGGLDLSRASRPFKKPNDGAALVLCAERSGTVPSAVAVLLGPP